jgi:hypothetical protein
MIDDWTGDRHMENWECFGKDRHLGVPCPKPESESLLMIDQDLALDVDLDLESEYGPVSGEPYDPHLADVDKIIKRYDEKDVNEELQAKRNRLPGDPRGGLDQISAALAAHNSESDNSRLKEILESYTTGAKGPDGTPNRERWLEKWNAQLAAKECLGLWVTLSEGAVEKFMDKYFEPAWARYDQYGRGNIDELNYLPFIRDFMGSMTDGSDPFPESPAVKKVPEGVKVLDVEPIVEPDTPVVKNEGKIEKTANTGAQAPSKDVQSVNNDSNKPVLDNEKAPSTNPNAANGKADIEAKPAPSAGLELSPSSKDPNSAKSEEVSAASTKVDSKTEFLNAQNTAITKDGAPKNDLTGVDPKSLEKDPMDQTTGIDPTEKMTATGELKTATVGLNMPEPVAPSDIGEQDLGLSPSQRAAAAAKLEAKTGSLVKKTTTPAGTTPATTEVKAVTTDTTQEVSGGGAQPQGVSLTPAIAV